MPALWASGPACRSPTRSRPRFFGLAAFSLAIATAATNPAQTSTAEPLMDAYRWNKRPVIVAAPNANASLVQDQRKILSVQKHALQARDMVWIEILGDQVTIDGKAMPDIAASQIRDRYGIRKGEALALLVGKDGGVKMKSPTAISAHELFETIDAMPMRRREMNTGN